MTNEEFLREISLEGEVWKDVVGFECRYAVSNKSRVVSYPRPHNHGWVLKPAPMSHGYRYVSMYDANGKHYCVGLHRIVAEAFIPNPSGYKFIDHINGIRDDNRIENLRWCNRQMNMNNPITKSRISESKKGKPSGRAKGIVQILNDKVIAVYRTSVEASANFNGNFSSICACCRGEIEQYAGFKWMYLSDYEASNQ